MPATNIAFAKAGLNKLIHWLEFAIHAMTQILEKSSTRQKLNQLMGSGENIHFILRTGYLKSYPPPVSLRRPVDYLCGNDGIFIMSNPYLPHSFFIFVQYHER